jgi:hypothetical protein
MTGPPDLRVFANVPGYTRALERAYRLEESYREFTYLDAPEFICGVEVRPLTLQMYLQLCAARSPFLVGGRYPFIQDVAVFLFRLSPAYDQAGAAKAEARTKVSTAARLSRRELIRIARENGLISHSRSFVIRHSSLVILLQKHTESIAQNAFSQVRREFIDRIITLPFRPAVRAINRFLFRMLLDRPPVGKNKNASIDPSDTSAGGDMIHMLAAAYGWQRAAILQLPMPEVFQSLRNIYRDNPHCSKPLLAKRHPLANRLTRKHRAIARRAARRSSPEYLARLPEIERRLRRRHLRAASEAAPCS